jgi:hypothetical protein
MKTTRSGGRELINLREKLINHLIFSWPILSRLSRSSAVLALIYIDYNCNMALDAPGFVIRITFLDFRKAYDLIDHNILVDNFCKISIRPALVTWLASYLSDRNQVTKFGSELSDRYRLHLLIIQMVCP